MKINFIRPSQLDRSDPGSWPVYYKILAWIAIAVIILFFLKKILLNDTLAMIETNNNKIMQIEINYKNNYHYILELSAYKTRLENLQELLKQLLNYLPSKQQTAKVVDNVKNAASENKIAINSWIPMKSVKMQYYDIEPIKLIAETEFLNFTYLFESIANFEQIMNVANFSLTPSKTNSASELISLSVNAQLRTYIYNQAPKINYEN